MVRLADLPVPEREAHLKRITSLPAFEKRPFVKGLALAQRRIAIITTAGLHLRSDLPFDNGGAGTDYRVIPVTTAPADVVMSHASVNFDRSGFQSDWNVMFPLDRLKELVHDKIVGALANFHYSFMGAMPQITRFEPKARELAKLLRDDGVDGAVLTPV